MSVNHKDIGSLYILLVLLVLTLLTPFINVNFVYSYKYTFYVFNIIIFIISLIL